MNIPKKGTPESKEYWRNRHNADPVTPAITRAASKAVSAFEKRKVHESLDTLVAKLAAATGRSPSVVTWDEIVKDIILLNGKRAGDCTMEEILASYRPSNA